MQKKINTFILYLTNGIMHAMPETKCFGLKRSLLRLSGIEVGNNVRVCSSVQIIGGGHLAIGDDTFIGPQTFIHVTSSVVIGNCCDISSNVIIINGTHEIDIYGSHIAGKGRSEDVVIGDGTWVCTNSTILGSSHIGKRCLVSASSTTKGHYPDLSILKGCIAKATHIER